MELRHTLRHWCNLGNPHQHTETCSHSQLLQVSRCWKTLCDCNNQNLYSCNIDMSLTSAAPKEFGNCQHSAVFCAILFHSSFVLGSRRYSDFRQWYTAWHTSGTIPPIVQVCILNVNARSEYVFPVAWKRRATANLSSAVIVLFMLVSFLAILGVTNSTKR